MTRIKYLDGLRGLAILLVIFYHAFYRWVDIVPYGNEYESFIIFKYGYLGVQLFFLLSGFVILMTLEKCKGAYDFLKKRWLRLFPAMLICSLFIFFSAGIFFERPNGQPTLQNLISGLIFIDPYLINIITNLSLESLEGSFWSLYVEFQFYIFAAIIYFLVGNRLLIMVTLCCFLLSVILINLNIIFDNTIIRIASTLTSNVIQFGFFGWFAAGSSFYMFTKSREKEWFYCGVAIATFSSVSSADIFSEEFIATLFISILFALSVVNLKFQRLLSNRILLIFGFISYPLYLIHENMMIAIVIKLNPYLPGISSLILTLIAVLFISIISFIIAKYFESPLHQGIKYLLINIESSNVLSFYKNNSKEISKI